MGVNEKLITMETNIATVAVTPNSKSIRPVTLDRNETGKKTITKEMVVARTANPISLVPSIDARIGSIPSSSIQR